MVKVRIRDEGGQFRIEIAGRFAGTVVDDVLYIWKNALVECSPRRVSVDITELTGYDYAGCSLLRDMHRHGTHIAASTPKSLVFLDEISGPRLRSPQLVPRPTAEEPGTASAKRGLTSFRRTRAAASGE